MSGLTAEGLVIQRLSDVLAANRQKAVELFQDLVPAGEVVDTSDNTLLGRLISLAAPSIADLWEGLQQVDSAFDPDKATGLALDKLVKLGGLERFKEQKATSQAIITGDSGTIVPYNSAARGSGTNALWRTRSPVTISTTSSSGIRATISTVSNSTLYSVSYTTVDGTKTVSYTSDGSATQQEINNGLIAAALLSPHNNYIYLTQVTGTTTLQVLKKDPYSFSTFTTTANITIDKYQHVVELQAEEAGEIEQDINTITTIATPVLGWDSIYNYTAATGGSGEEKDDELRIRFRDTKYERASNILEALYSALINVEGVTEVVIYENDTDSTDSDGRPPHCFMPIVVGGDTATLAKVIWENKPLGILSYQIQAPSTSYPTGYTTIYDSQGFPHYIGLNRPVPTTLYISMTLTKTTGVFPSDGDDQIKNAIVAYLEENFGIGDDIIYSRLYTPINSVLGHQVDSLTIGTSSSPVGTSNITIPFNGIYTLDPTNIIITTAP